MTSMPDSQPKTLPMADIAHATDQSRQDEDRATPQGQLRRYRDPLNQSQGGMCDYNTSVIGLGFPQKSFGL